MGETFDIRSNLVSRLEGEALSVVVGTVAAGAAKVDIRQQTISRARLGDGHGVQAARMNILALGESDAYLDTQAGSGGVAAGAGAANHLTQNATTEARLGNAEVNVLATDLASGDDARRLLIQADQVFDFDGRIVSASGGVLAGAGAESRYWIDADTTARVDDSALVEAGTIQVYSDTAVVKDRLHGEDRDNIRGVAGGAVAGAGASSIASLDLDTRVEIGDAADLISNDGDIRLEAMNDVVFHERINLTAGGVASGAGITADIHDDNMTATVDVGENAEIASFGDLVATARGSGDVSLTLLMDTYGGATVGVADASAVLSPDNAIYIREGALMEGLGNVDIVAGADRNGDRDEYAISAMVDSFAGSVIPIDDLNSLAKMDQTSHIEIEQDALVTSARDILLFTERFGFSDLESQAKGVNWLSATGDAIDEALGSGGSEAIDGDAETDAEGDVVIDGKVETGFGRHKRLVLQIDPEYRDASPEELQSLSPSDLIVAEKGYDDIGFTVGSTQAEAELVDELERLSDEYSNYRNAGNNRLNDFYEEQIERVENELVDQGFGEIEDGAFVRNEQDQLTVFLDDAWAQAGTIYVYADRLTGDGDIEAPTDASLTVLNKAPSQMIVGDMEIPRLSADSISTWRRSPVTTTSLNSMKAADR